MRFITIKPVFFVLLILFSALVFSQQKEEYFFSQIKNEDGLSQSTVRAIIQDKKGYMWFGTANGLNRYDGYSFLIYNTNPLDSSSISGNGIASLFEDSEGYIWVGTNDGMLNRYDRKTDSFLRIDLVSSLQVYSVQTDQYYEYPISFSRNNDNAINTIAEDSSGNLWLGTWGKGIIRYNKSTGDINHFFNHPTQNMSLGHNRIMKILIDRDQNIWIGTFGGGLNKIVPGNTDETDFIKYKSDPSNPASLSDNKIISLYEDTDGDIWIGTYNGGLNRINHNKGADAGFDIYTHEENNPNSLSNNIIMSLLEDRRGYLWIGTFGGGLNRFEKTTGRFIHFQSSPLKENSLADNDVLSLCEDRSGILWIGTHLGEGISMLQKNKHKFNLLAKNSMSDNTLSDDVIWSVHKDNVNNNLWIGTYRGGLNKYDRKNNKVTVYKADPSNKFGLTDNHLRALKMDKQGNLWIGTYSAGLNKFVPSEGKFYRYQHDPENDKSLGANQVLGIIIDDEGVFWIATFGGGLNKFIPEKNEFTRYMHDPSDETTISENRVYSLLQSRNGEIWVGTFGGGLEKFDKETGEFTHFRHQPGNENSISHNRVMAVFEDSNGKLWIGTYGGGLNKFDPASKKFTRFGRSKGITSEVVYGILEDKNKNIWISSDNGIFKLNLDTENISHYDIQDGLQGLEYSGGAYYRSDDGELFFGGIKGLNYFYPEDITENTYVPPIVITSVKIFNNQLQGERDNLLMDHDQNFVSFEFAALDFAYPPDNHYQYMLEGLDPDWRDAPANMRVASYTNLAPGDYVFYVRGSNNDDVWNMNPAALRFTIMPPFWMTWWFITLSLLLIGSTIYYLSTLRIKSQLAIERLKTKLAADLHDNVGSGLTEISILSEVAKHKLSNGGSNELKHISEISRHLVDNMSDIVWVVNPKRDSLYDLILRLKDTYSDLLSSIGISFKTSNLEKLIHVKLPMEYRQNLYLIFKEGINNCIKHSSCKKITLECNLRGDVLEMVLNDDGKGFEPRDKGKGNGLKNIERRAEEIGGRVKWKSSPNDGSSVVFLGRIQSRPIRFRRKKFG